MTSVPNYKFVDNILWSIWDIGTDWAQEMFHEGLIGNNCECTMN